MNRETLLHVADVARLNLSESEIKEFLPQLDKVIKVFSEISEIDTKGISPSFQPLDIKDSLREDIPGQVLTQEEALKNTKHKKNGYFKGPKVI